MNVLILAAGYATRLYPLTLNKAKPLLDVAGKPMLAWVVDNLRGVAGIETIYIVTNAKFSADFETWAKNYQRANPEFRFKIVNDGSTGDENKLGAIGDINLVLTRENAVGSDLLVIAGDNLFRESLAGFVDYAKKTQATVGVHRVDDREAIKKYGVVTVDADGVITHLKKSRRTQRAIWQRSHCIFIRGVCCRFLPPTLQLEITLISPVFFYSGSIGRGPVNTFEITGQWLDIGSKETLEEANRLFAER
jgi:dTDP-glucose pyrophosphorylase